MYHKKLIKWGFIGSMVLLLTMSQQLWAQIQREFEIKVTDSGLYFDGEQRKTDMAVDKEGFEYYFGRRITPHGDCIKKYGDFLFLTWYMGGEENKNVMLSRLHIPTQTLETIKFPHTHVGFQHKYPHIGDSHNTIAVGICPLDSTVHLLYDMHSYSQADYPDSYFNYQVSLKGAANAPVDSFNIDLFQPRQTYLNPVYNYSDITYPNFFLNTDNELFVWFREGGNNNGSYKFAKYSGGTWGAFTNFSTLNAKSSGSAYNWGLYGDMKYINGKLRIGFLKRMSYNDDKYVYNNGFHYAYTNDPAGQTEWYNYKAEPFSLPLVHPEKIFFHEPGDEVTQGGANSVYIASGTDFTVTDTEAVHFITNSVKSNVDGQRKNVHAYKQAGDSVFSISTNFPGGSLYAVEGNQVFLMSSNNNRPEIYKAEGGTNNWEKIYTATSGISMEHSNVLIADGKLFVYAMQKASGDARPIYIQMYDLDITPIDTSRHLSFDNLNDGQEIELGSSIGIEANVGSAFKEVSLWSGTTNLGTLTAAPYLWSSHPILTDMTDRVYTFKLIAKDENDEQKETSIAIYTPEVYELATGNSLHISFEDEAIANWETDGSDYGVTPTIIDGTNVRAGSKVMALEYSGSTSGHHVQNIVDKIVVPDQHYFHMIAYTATSDISSGQTYPTAKLGDWAPTPGFTGHADALVFERKVTSRQNTKGDSLNCYPRLRSKANGGACAIYYDDIILYTDKNETADLESPTVAENLSLNEPSSGTVELTWTEGVDVLTGVQATLILRTSDLSAPAPDMKAQAAYGTADIIGGIDTIAKWDVLALLPAGTLSYTDEARVADETYNYAIVHRDLAYNYSTPLVGGDAATKLAEAFNSSFKCFGAKGSIQLYDLEMGVDISIYNMNGVKVFQQRTSHSNLSVVLPQGIYMVKVLGDVVKVVVK